jgi:hypothetical protein
VRLDSHPSSFVAHLCPSHFRECSKPEPLWENIVCRVCGGGESDDQIILCDGCNNGFHLYCFTPPLKEVPEGRWFCEECEAKPLLLQMRMAVHDQIEEEAKRAPFNTSVQDMVLQQKTS